MKNINNRVLEAAKIFIDDFSTVRDVAKKIGCSKSTIHKDFTERLEQLNQDLYLQVKEILSYNKTIRHIRGGEATRKKFIN